MAKKPYWALAAMLLTACASTADRPLSMSQANEIAGKSLVVVTHEKPSFTAGTAGKGMFAAIGAIAMIQEGNEIIRTNNVQDPSVDIGERIAQSLAARYDLVTQGGSHISETGDLNELAGQYDDSQLSLFSQTRGWNFMYFPTDWDNYRVNVNMALSLTDTNTRSVLASGNCIYSPEYDDSDQAPTHDYLLSDRAGGLKAELKKGADYCTQKFLSETFS